MTLTASEYSPDELAAIWRQRLDAGALSHADEEAFNAWLTADPNNPARLGEAELIWNGARDVADSPEMIQYRAEAVEQLRRANARRWSRGFDWRPWAAIAACLLLALGLFAHIMSDPALSYRTGVGERRVVQLEDGTRLTMDGATRVDVRMDDNSRRLELVSGRAKFDVAHDALRPLSVLARNRVTVATGTSFSVELLPDQVRVVLYEGRVEVATKPSGGAPAALLPRATAATGLVPGRQLVASTSSAATRVAPLDVPQSLSWEGGMLHFNGEPLALAVERMNRDARTPLVLGDAKLGRLAISGAFDSRHSEAFVEGVSALYPVVARVEPDRIVLEPRRTAK